MASSSGKVGPVPAGSEAAPAAAPPQAVVAAGGSTSSVQTEAMKQILGVIDKKLRNLEKKKVPYLPALRSGPGHPLPRSGFLCSSPPRTPLSLWVSRFPSPPGSFLSPAACRPVSRRGCGSTFPHHPQRGLAGPCPAVRGARFRVSVLLHLAGLVHGELPRACSGRSRCGPGGGSRPKVPEERPPCPGHSFPAPPGRSAQPFVRKAQCGAMRVPLTGLFGFGHRQEEPPLPPFSSSQSLRQRSPHPHPFVPVGRGLRELSLCGGMNWACNRPME